MVDITHLVRQEVEKAGVKDGLCVVYVPHTTSGITINEGADPAVCSDIIKKLKTLVPPHDGYEHMEGKFRQSHQGIHHGQFGNGAGGRRAPGPGHLAENFLL